MRKKSKAQDINVDELAKGLAELVEEARKIYSGPGHEDYPQPWSYEQYPGHHTFDITAANGAYVGRVEVEELAQAICAQFGGGKAMSLAEQFPVAVPV